MQKFAFRYSENHIVHVIVLADTLLSRRYLYIFDLNVIPCDDCDARNESSGSEVQLSFAGLQHFSGQHLEDLMSHLPRSVQALHLDASWRS